MPELPVTPDERFTAEQVCAIIREERAEVERLRERVDQDTRAEDEWVRRYNQERAKVERLREALENEHPIPDDLVQSIHRMLEVGHRFWEDRQHSPDSDEMSAALTDLYMACKRHGIERDDG